MKRTINEQDGLGNPTVPAGYGKPDFAVGDATNPGPNPDQTLSADTATAMSAGEDNPGFSMGDAQDSLSEYETAKELDGAMIGVDKPTPENNPTFGMSTVSEEEEGTLVTENDVTMDANGNVVDFGANPVSEDDDTVTFDSVDEMPEFEDYDETDFVDAEYDGSGVIEPEVIDINPEDPELGPIPDVELPMTEPIVQVEEDEPDIYASESELTGEDPEPIIVTESFRLPENRQVVVAKGDQIFVIGHAVNEKTPKFTESAFKRAFRSLVESKDYKGQLSFKKSEGMKKCALVGRSLILEAGKDWRIPGTDCVIEEHDIIQIVSMKPIVEKEMPKKAEKDCGEAENGKETPDEESEEEKKAKKEYYLAQKRYFEAKAKREGKKSEEDDTRDKPEEKPQADDDKDAKENDKKKAEAYLRRNGVFF